MGDSEMYVKSDDISVKLCKAFNKLQMDDIAVSKAVKHLRKLHDENVEDTKTKVFFEHLTHLLRFVHLTLNKFILKKFVN